MPYYRLLRGSIGKVEDGKNVIYKPGPHTYVELSPAQAGRMVDMQGPRVEGPIDIDALEAQSEASLAAQAQAQADAASGSDQEPTTLVQHLNVEDAVKFINTIEEEALLDAVELEETGRAKPRKGVRDAVAAVRAEFNVEPGPEG